jgi:hypothetical protein
MQRGFSEAEFYKKQRHLPKGRCLLIYFFYEYLEEIDF